MNNQLKADLFLRPAGDSVRRSASHHRCRRWPTRSQPCPESPESIAFADMRSATRDCPQCWVPPTPSAITIWARFDFFSGRPTAVVNAELRAAATMPSSASLSPTSIICARAIPSRCLWAERRCTFRVIDVFYDYGSEKGFIVVDRSRHAALYCPIRRHRILAVYVAPGSRSRWRTKSRSRKPPPDTTCSSSPIATCARRPSKSSIALSPLPTHWRLLPSS